MHASNHTWKGRGRATTASQSGKIKIGGVASLRSIWRTTASTAGMKRNFAPCLSRAVMERSRVVRLSRNSGYQLMPPKSARVCFTFLGIGIMVMAATLSALGLTPSGEIVCFRKWALVVLMFILWRGKVSGCFCEGF